MPKVDFQVYLWAVGVLQPTNATQVRHFLESALPNIAKGIKTKDIKDKLDRLVGLKLVAPASMEADYWLSLTKLGGQVMNYKLRIHRDKARLFFLKEVASLARNKEHQKERGLELAGESPALESSTNTQCRRPIPTVADTVDRVYWSSTFKQLRPSAGPSLRSNIPPLDLYSYSDSECLNNACWTAGVSRENLSLVHLATAMGISPNLLTSMGNRPQKHYRTFEIGKRTGGKRLIHSPRVFLKTVQYWLKDYFLYKLIPNDVCHSFRRGHSIVSNAQGHVGKKYVANIDIVDYFGSIKRGQLEQVLRAEFGSNLSGWISKLCTVNNFLPQGAPTSPLLSNYFLRVFDQYMDGLCQEENATFTRYADDITISGESREVVGRMIQAATVDLLKLNLVVNDKKTRIASQSGQQVVTGVVVNKHAQPPRKLRKRVRAMFHQASLHPDKYVGRIEEMQGYLSYFKGYPHLVEHISLVKYVEVLEQLRNYRK
jgi:retron-type reverse transcriptase